MITLPSRDTNAGVLVLMSWGLILFWAPALMFAPNPTVTLIAGLAALPLAIWLFDHVVTWLVTEMYRFNQWAPRA